MEIGGCGTLERTAGEVGAGRRPAVTDAEASTPFVVEVGGSSRPLFTLQDNMINNNNVILLCSMLKGC